VSDSNLAVISYVISRLKHGYQTWLTIDRTERRRMLRQIVTVHEDNRAMYCFVAASRRKERWCSNKGSGKCT
jgi:hypothetical protein